MSAVIFEDNLLEGIPLPQEQKGKAPPKKAKKEHRPLTEREVERFRALQNENYKQVFNLAYRLSGTRSDAEDLTQDAFVRAYQAFDDYSDKRPFNNWVFRIVTRLYLDMLRTRRRRVKTASYDTPLQSSSGEENLYFEMSDDKLNPERATVDGEYSEKMQKALNHLSPKQRLLVTLADIEDVTYREIGEMLGIPIGTVRSKLHRIHKLLREKMTIPEFTAPKKASLTRRRAAEPAVTVIVSESKLYPGLTVADEKDLRSALNFLRNASDGEYGIFRLHAAKPGNEESEYPAIQRWHEGSTAEYNAREAARSERQQIIPAAQKGAVGNRTALIP